MIGFNTYRSLLHINKDPFQDYKLNNSEEDRQKLKEFSNAFLEIGKNCFRECISLNTQYFAKKEEKCVEDCVKFHHQSMLNILKFHNSNKDGLKNKNPSL